MLKTIGYKILVSKVEEQDTVLAEKLGGFTIPAGTMGDYEVYEVKSLGARVDELSVGDVVYTTPKPGKEFRDTLTGEKYRVIETSDILVVKENGK